jgi:hypothetical protein
MTEIYLFLLSYMDSNEACFYLILQFLNNLVPLQPFSLLTKYQVWMILLQLII